MKFSPTDRELGFAALQCWHGIIDPRSPTRIAPRSQTILLDFTCRRFRGIFAPMKTRPAPKPRRVTRQDAKQLIDEYIESALPPFAVDASGPSDLGAQDIATWTAASGWTPIEFLTHTYRNGWQRMEHRISAAKAVLEYNHRKLPDQVEIDLKSKSLVLDSAALSSLSDKDLAILEKLLEKAGAKTE